MMSHGDFDYLSHLEDEIALEGLDGITIEGLWLRLSLRHEFKTNMSLDNQSKEFLWTLIIQDEEIDFFCLVEPRSELKFFNRYEYIDSEMGLVLEPQEDIMDIYPYVRVEDKENGIRGSCSTYYTRKNITENVTSLSLGDVVEMYGNKLVLVASQALRDKALAINAAVDKFYDLRLKQYIMLERIGRSRTMGEITYGKNSLAVMQIPPKTMFYYRKRLLKLNLIRKQSHRQRSVKGNLSSSSLLHLARFYVIRRSKFIIMIQKVVEILQSKPDFTWPLTEVKEEIGLQNISSKKVFKSSDFVKHVQTLMVPYRQIHPNATIKEWKCKSRNEEKMIRCLQLVNPDVSIEDILQGEEEEEVDEDDSFSGLLDQSNVVYGKSLLHQAYLVIRSAGPDGLTQMEMSKILGLSKLDSRTICRGLQKRNVIHSLMKDIGRQRVTKFVSNKYASTGHLLQEYETERKKMMKHVEDSEKAVGGSDEAEQHMMHYQTSTPSTSRIMDTDLLENLEIGVEVSHDISTTDSPINMSQETSLESLEDGASDNREDGEITITCSEPSLIQNNKDKIVPNSKLTTSSKSTYINHKKVSPHLTTRMIKRSNIIMDAVRKYKVIDDALKLQKMIINAEQKEGVEGKMDKKSLTRLLDRLGKQEYLKTLFVTMRAGAKNRVFTFVLHPELTTDDKLVKMAIQQQKHKFVAQVCSSKRDHAHPRQLVQDKNEKATRRDESHADNSSKEVAKAIVKQEPSVGCSVLEMEKMHNLGSLSIKNEQTSENYSIVGVKGNVGPKFVRMQEFHKLLFYLVYGHEGRMDLDQEMAWRTIVGSAIQDLSSESAMDYPTIYVPEISWKMFIPPLPNHPSVPVDGWLFMVDVLLRLPLSIFVPLVRVAIESTLLTAYLNHPIKKHLLVKDLPPDLRRGLLNGRRYVTYVMELCNRLCYIGLLQKGAQIMKDKDQIFVYLNRKATLVDTTTSDPGYHHISVDKEYVRKEYVFINLNDVNQYWYDMNIICMHTPLGGQVSVQGKKITIQFLHKKPEMIESTKPRSFQEAQQRDLGHIPGDEKGAAGLDSAMYAHLKRNWTGSNSRFNAIAQTPSAPSASDSEKNSTDVKFSYAQYLRNSCTPGFVENAVSKNKVAGFRNVRLSLYKPKVETEGSKILTVSVGLVDTTKKRKRETPKDTKVMKKAHGKDKSSYLREVKARQKAPKKPYYDEEDKAALRRMNKLRVDWYPAEDSFLLLCKVSSAYLFPMKRTQVVNFSVIRDLLHARYPDSMNKTSKACQRRINYIMKNPATEENVAVILEEIKQDEEITNMFKPAKLNYTMPMLHKLYVNPFKELVGKLVTKYASNKSKMAPRLPDTFSDFENKFKVIRTAYSLRAGPEIKELNSIADIDHYVVHALIFSSLCTKQDRESWAYQLYLAYQKYEPKLLNTVLTFIRETKMISYRKSYNRSKYIRTCLPLSTSPFQLSLSFIYVFHMKYPFEVFGSCWDMTKNFVGSKVEALSKSNRLLPLMEEPLLENESTVKMTVEKPIRKRKAPKIGIKAKIRGRGKSFNKQKQQRQQITENATEIVLNTEQNAGCQDLNALDYEEKGVRLSTTVVGGGCATVVSLAATKRITFDIVIPDQLIAVDNQTKEKDEDRSKLLEKIEYHEMVSGRKFALSEELNKTWFPSDEDIYTERADECTEVDPLAVDEQNSYLDYSEVPEPLPQSEPVKRKICEENEVRCKKLKPSVCDQQEEECSATNEEVQKDVNQRPKNSQSRIRMYMMREQMSDTGLATSYWAFDNIFINTCEVSCKLKPVAVPVTGQLRDISEAFMPISKDVVNNALAARKKVVLSSWTKLDTAVSEWKKDKRDTRFISTAKKLHSFIESKKDLGATTSEIKEEFPNPKLQIMKVLGEMEEMTLVLRVGVDTFRWVVIQFSKQWLIRTNKMSRAKMNSTDSVRLSGVYDVEEGAEDEPKIKQSRQQLLCGSYQEEKETKVPDEGECEEKASTSTCTRSKRKKAKSKIALLKKSCPKDAEAAYKMENTYDHSSIAANFEEIEVLVRPWVRLNGCLNRRVMDRILGSVLCHVMENPGISGCQIAKKFWPAIQPVHTYELLETLMTIKAINRSKVKKLTQDFLLSDDQDFEIEPADDYDFDDNFKYESEPDCVPKLATFIGDKKYSQEFLATCR